MWAECVSISLCKWSGVGELPTALCNYLARALWDLLENAITLRSLALLLVRLGTARVVTQSRGRGGEAWTRHGQVQVPPARSFLYGTFMRTCSGRWQVLFRKGNKRSFAMESVDGLQDGGRILVI